MANTFPATGNVGCGTATPTAPLEVSGSGSGAVLLVSNTTTGTAFSVKSTASNNITLSHSGYGDFMVVGPGNSWNCGSFAFNSMIRGILTSSSTAGVDAIQGWHGHCRFNVYDGRTFIGQNVPDDGVSNLQVNGAMWTNALQVKTGATAGYVLTSDASGNATWQASSGGGGTSGTYTPSVGTTSNMTSVFISSAYYTVVGSVVTVTVNGSFIPTVANTQTLLTLSLPFTSTLSNSTYLGSASLLPNSSVPVLPGIAKQATTTTFDVRWQSNSATGATAPFVVTIQFTK